MNTQLIAVSSGKQRIGNKSMNNPVYGWVVFDAVKVIHTFHFDHREAYDYLNEILEAYEKSPSFDKTIAKKFMLLELHDMVNVEEIANSEYTSGKPIFNRDLNKVVDLSSYLKKFKITIDRVFK